MGRSKKEAEMFNLITKPRLFTPTATYNVKLNKITFSIHHKLCIVTISFSDAETIFQSVH